MIPERKKELLSQLIKNNISTLQLWIEDYERLMQSPDKKKRQYFLKKKEYVKWLKKDLKEMQELQKEFSI